MTTAWESTCRRSYKNKKQSIPDTVLKGLLKTSFIAKNSKDHINFIALRRCPFEVTMRGGTICTELGEESPGSQGGS